MDEVSLHVVLSHGSLLSSEKGINMKKAIILEIMVTKNRILPCQFQGDMQTTVRRIDLLTPEESCNQKGDCLFLRSNLETVMTKCKILLC